MSLRCVCLYGVPRESEAFLSSWGERQQERGSNRDRWRTTKLSLPPHHTRHLFPSLPTSLDHQPWVRCGGSLSLSVDALRVCAKHASSCSRRDPPLPRARARARTRTRDRRCRWRDRDRWVQPLPRIHQLATIVQVKKTTRRGLTLFPQNAKQTRRQGSRLARPCRQGARPDAQGPAAGEEEEAHGPRVQAHEVQPPLRQRR